MEFENIPFAEFLEKAIPLLVSMRAGTIGIVAINEDGEIGTMYFNADATAKALMADSIQFDSFLEKLEINKDILRGILE